MSHSAAPATSPRRKRVRFLLLLLLVPLALLGAGALYIFRPLPVAASPALAMLKPSLDDGVYLAKIGNCSACHSPPGAAPYAGGVKFKTDFGTIFSTNITPDPKYGIGTWEFADFHAAMKHGVRPDGAHLYPAFPYNHFAALTDKDIASLWLYMKSLQPVAMANRPNAMSFPFGERRLLYFWKRLFHNDAAFGNDSAQAAQWKRGRYLVESIAHCGACHTPRNALGGLNNARMFQGGSYTDQTPRGTYRRWSAVDLTPGTRGLAQWSKRDIADYLLTGKNRHAVVHGPMIEVYESTRHLSVADANSIATYLKSLPPRPAATGWRMGRGTNKDGATVYAVHCATCHLPGGRGDPILGVPLRQNPIVQADDPASLINVILYGPHLPPPPFSTGRSNMKPFGKRLSDEDIAALASFLRSDFGNDAPGVSPDQVAEQR